MSVAFIRKQWFLASLLIVIPLGLGVGVRVSPTDWQEIASGLPAGLISFMSAYSRLATATILFLMSFSLESRRLGEAIRSPFPVLVAVLINYAAMPLLAFPLSKMQLTPDFAIGLAISASVPCTMAAASVWTRKAAGNDAISLMVTMFTNGVCFLVTPFWIAFLIGQSIDLDPAAMMWRLALSVLLPCLLGQLCRTAKSPREWATRNKTQLGVVAQLLILTLILLASISGGQSLNGNGAGPGTWAILLVLASGIALHLIAMVGAWAVSRGFGFKRDDMKAVLFAASQKTLPIGVLIATDPTMLGNPNLLGEGVGVPFAVFPMLMFHASQLFIDTAVAGYLAKNKTDVAS
ncbi:bile acid:sodium symporter family protein [Thalassoroseus pseudoceratinae]|uniref:bile acid:sodium symporter family protein n=1 Tax=Thalassoroseus pseudoceratinae TaxID=2713176 RepID=UPI00141F49F1|nr:bile acid:sodium symporter [Thalassoroseus pseudoceratinae]